LLPVSEMDGDDLSRAKQRCRLGAAPPEPGALRSAFGDLPQTNFRDVPDFHFPVERNMPRHADLASVAFPTLRELIGGSPGKPATLRVCIVTFDFEGPTRAGGLASAYRRLAELLRDAGHRVTVLYMRGQNCDDGPVGKWVVHYAAAGIEFAPLPPPRLPSVAGVVPSATTRSCAAYEWLEGRSFDVIHSTAARGCIHAAVTAKRLGLGFADTLFVVEAWPPTLWSLLADGRSIDSLRALAVTAMERKCVELADIVISPSRHMLRWMMRQGYDLPKHRCAIQPLALGSQTWRQGGGRPARTRITELVFVGSWDRRKGIGAFHRALEMLGDELRGVAVTLLCEAAAGFSMKDELARRRADRPYRLHIREVAGVAEAVSYLGGDGRLAVVPSLLDACPERLAGCLANAIPVIVSSEGGAHEMIHEQDRPAAVCAPTPAELAARIRSALRDGAIAARPSPELADGAAIWKDAHLALGEPDLRQRYGGRAAHRTWNGADTAEHAEAARPLVSVCITHFNRPAQLAIAIDSVRQQTYPNIEIVVVDDGSTRPEAHDYLDRLGRELADAKRGRVVRQDNRYLGAARNAGIRHSTGEFILMMDDDDLARPNEVETFVRAAGFSGADMLCCHAETFTGPGLPSDGLQYHECISPLGDSVSLGLFVNCLGGSHCFTRRRVFEALGGFTEDYGIGLDDHEFSLRAVLRGFKLLVVPQALYWYRLSPVRLKDRHFDPLSGMNRVFNAVLDNAPLCLSDALRFAQVNSRMAPPPPQDDGLVQAIRTRIRQLRTARLIRSSGLFDAAYYLRSNPDVAGRGVDAVMHFVEDGAREGRRPNPQFDPAEYLEDFPELRASGANPLAHFIRSAR
jgi:glycosyltransferase involved in cell wall biosynthesis